LPKNTLASAHNCNHRPPISNTQRRIDCKKSRFIGIAAAPCSSWNEAQLHSEQLRKDHPKLRLCFGFVSENCVQTEMCLENGEPTGTSVSAFVVNCL
jgi:putative IMPACT (imprinted ancient) family translation regulator